MKKIILISIFLLLASGSSFAMGTLINELGIGGSLGLNFNSLSSSNQAVEDNNDGATTFFIGAKAVYLLDKILDKNMAVNADLLYDTRKIESSTSVGGLTITTQTKFTYLSLIPKFQYKLDMIPVHLLLLAGPRISIKLDDETETTFNNVTTTTATNNAESLIFGLVFGVGYNHKLTVENLSLSIQPELTYDLALSNTNERGIDFKIHTLRLKVAVLF